jgi:hypothetical protein
MRVILGEREVAITPGAPARLAIEVTNDLTVIDGLSIHLLSPKGLTWSGQPSSVPLFPDATGTITLEINVERWFPAGSHSLQLEVRSSVTAEAVREQFNLTVEPRPAGALMIEPALRLARGRANFAVRIENQGNTTLEVMLEGSDANRQTRIAFTPAFISVAPAARYVAAMDVRTKRRFFGGDSLHRLNVTATTRDLELEGVSTFRQQPIIPRGARTAAVLAVIVGVWAAIFTVVLDKALTRDPLTKQVPASFYAAQANRNGPTKLSATSDAGLGLDATVPASPAGAVPKSGIVIGVGGTISGTVDAASTGQGIGRISVEAVDIEPTGASIVASAATQSDGTYAIQGLLPGAYKLLFEAQGYTSVWFPDASSISSAKSINVAALGQTSGVDVTISGQPGSISGTVNTGVTPSAPVTVTVQPEQGSGAPIATVKTNPDGSYEVPNLPTPGAYDLSYSATNYTVSSATYQLSGGQHYLASTIEMSASDGTITGTVTAAGKALGGVSISAQANGQTFTSATPTTGPVGRFVLVGLPTPATYLLTFTISGYGTRVIGENLGPGQDLTDLAVEMQGGAGDVSGVVSDNAGHALGGVSVTVAAGATPITTQTLTAGTIGSYSLSGLTTPGRYAITFSLSGYESQTVGVTLSSSGSADNVDVQLPPLLGSISGTVNGTSGGLSGVKVSATNGTSAVMTTTTTQPSGGFLLTGLSPGSYSVTFSVTGYANETYLVHVTPGSSNTINATLASS